MSNKIPQIGRSVEQIKQDNHWPLDSVAGKGLIPIIQNHGNDLTGCEIGVAYGWNLYNTLEQCANIKMMYGIDPYTPYHDGTDEYKDQNFQDIVKGKMLNSFKSVNRFTLIQKTSDDALSDFDNNSLDYIFIDGDHAYEFVKKDIVSYYSKVKSGGIFAGHDYSWPGVEQALTEFFTEQNLDKSILQLCETDAWYFIKP